MASRLATSLLVLGTLHVLGVSSYSLTISPDYVFINHGLNTQSVICKAGVPLTGCQFMWRPITGSPGQVVELSQGHRTIPNSIHLGGEVLAYNYNGRDLESGDCGITLKMTGNKKLMIGCRVHTEDGGWTYAWMDLFADGWRVLDSTMTSRETVALPGDSVSLLVKALDIPRKCRFTPPGGITPLNFDRGGDSVTSSHRYRYLGTGLQSGDCGLTILQVSEADNGVAGAYVENSASHTFRFMSVIVAHKPSPPVLHVVNGVNDITATCKIERSRPIANITWYIGDDVIREDRLDDNPANPNDEWRWPWIEGSITQKLTRKLEPKDVGKVLKCSVAHVALPKPLESIHIISLPPTAHTTRLIVDTPCTCPDVIPCPKLPTRVDPATDELSSCTRKLQLLHHENTLRASTSPGGAGREISDKVDAAAVTVAELSIEEAKVKLEAAKSIAEAAKASAEALARQEESNALAADLAVKSAKSHLLADEARARREEAWAKNAEEELLFERRHRSHLEKQLEDAGLG